MQMLAKVTEVTLCCGQDGIEWQDDSPQGPVQYVRLKAEKVYQSDTVHLNRADHGRSWKIWICSPESLDFMARMALETQTWPQRFVPSHVQSSLDLKTVLSWLLSAALLDWHLAPGSSGC